MWACRVALASVSRGQMKSCNFKRKGIDRRLAKNDRERDIGVGILNRVPHYHWLEKKERNYLIVRRLRGGTRMPSKYSRLLLKNRSDYTTQKSVKRTRLRHFYFPLFECRNYVLVASRYFMPLSFYIHLVLGFARAVIAFSLSSETILWCQAMSISTEISLPPQTIITTLLDLLRVFLDPRTFSRRPP